MAFFHMHQQPHKKYIKWCNKFPPQSMLFLLISIKIWTNTFYLWFVSTENMIGKMILCFSTLLQALYLLTPFPSALINWAHQYVWRILHLCIPLSLFITRTKHISDKKWDINYFSGEFHLGIAHRCTNLNKFIHDYHYLCIKEIHTQGRTYLSTLNLI